MATAVRSGLLVGGLAVFAAAACSASAPAAASGFSWFAARPAPTGWHTITLPDGAATVSYPPSAHPAPGDPGTVTAATGSTDHPLVYFNATPQQGAETLTNWSRFRVEHLADDDASTVRLDAAATGLAFRGGTGTCVADHYRSRVAGHAYREIACLVVGAHGASVLVAATPADEWPHEADLLERAVEAYQVD